MQLIDTTNIEDYLRRTGRINPDETVRVDELPGGVSNFVIRVARMGGERRDFVLKQAREQLRVSEPWFCSVERILREMDVLRICQRLLSQNIRGTCAPEATTPHILFEDRSNYLFAMTAAPADHVTWKSQLLAGQTNVDMAATCGSLLAGIHGGTWRDSQIKQTLDDCQYFEDLRVDPYYRQLARVHPSLASSISRLIESLRQNRTCLVHGDFSPKNLLVYKEGLMLVDFEVGHFGDPAFDLGFFLAHLMLKGFHHRPHHGPYLALTEAFQNAYGRKMATTVPHTEYEELQSRAILNFAACALARVDGKSKVEYLDEEASHTVRNMAQRMLAQPADDWAEVLDRTRTMLDNGKFTAGGPT